MTLPYSFPGCVGKNFATSLFLVASSREAMSAPSMAANVDVCVCLGRFVNVELFERGFYEVRAVLVPSSAAPTGRKVVRHYPLIARSALNGASPCAPPPTLVGV